jgi:hypothetical protein
MALKLGATLLCGPNPLPCSCAWICCSAAPLHPSPCTPPSSRRPHPHAPTAVQTPPGATHFFINKGCIPAVMSVVFTKHGCRRISHAQVLSLIKPEHPGILVGECRSRCRHALGSITNASRLARQHAPAHPPPSLYHHPPPAPIHCCSIAGVVQRWQSNCTATYHSRWRCCTRLLGQVQPRPRPQPQPRPCCDSVLRMFLFFQSL